MNIQKAIVLRGKSATGKTTTTRKVIEQFIKRGYPETVIPPRRQNQKDVISLFEINGKWIAVCTAGDDSDTIENNIKRVEKKEKCVIFVMCSRSRDKKEFLKKHFGEENIIWHGRWAVSFAGDRVMEKELREKANFLQAEEIIQNVFDCLSMMEQKIESGRNK